MLILLFFVTKVIGIISILKIKNINYEIMEMKL
jgi:hypothetical protein